MSEEGKAAELEYVVVTEDDSSEPMELPTSPDDKSLGISTLTHAFPGAHGLKFKNPKTGASRALLMDTTGTKFLPPADGWADKVFTVIYTTASSTRGTSDQSVKRRKIEEEDDDSESGSHDGERRSSAYKQKRLDERRPVDMIVLGVNYKCTEEAFKKYFEQFGTVVVSDLKKDGEGKSKGFGFIQMSTIEEQDKVLAVSVHVLEGRRCEVKIPDQRIEQYQQQASRENSTSKVFVGRLPDDVTTDELRTFFEDETKKVDPSTSITDVFIPRPFRGFGFVTFSSTYVAKNLARSNNLVLRGNSITVSLAMPRADDSRIAFGQKRNYSRDYPGPPSYGGGGPSYPGRGSNGPPPMMSSYGGGGGYNASYGSGGYGYDREWDGPPPHSRNPNNGFFWQPSGGGGVPSRNGGGQPAPNPHATSLASGLDALNLNRSNNPEIMAAWQNFVKTLNKSGGPW